MKDLSDLTMAEMKASMVFGKAGRLDERDVMMAMEIGSLCEIKEIVR